MARATALVEGGTVYVRAETERYEVGELATILDLVGGPAWTITYSEAEQRRPDLDTSDEGLTVDVVDTIEAMTFGEDFVATLAALPAAPVGVESAATGSPATGADALPTDVGSQTADSGSPAAEAGGRADDPSNRADVPPNRADALSPRLGLFVGRLLENLEHGLQ